MHSPRTRLDCGRATQLGNLTLSHWLVPFGAFVASIVRGFELGELFLPLASFLPKLSYRPVLRRIFS
jgi:hypothetical protein